MRAKSLEIFGLSGDFGKRVCEALNAKINEDYPEFRDRFFDVFVDYQGERYDLARAGWNEEKQRFEGSNIALACIVNEVVQKEGYHAITPAEFNWLLSDEKYKDKLKKFGFEDGDYADCALALARNGANQMFAGREFVNSGLNGFGNVRAGALIPLNRVGIERTQKGLCFKLLGDANVLYPQIFGADEDCGRDGYFEDDCIDASTGMPFGFRETGGRLYFGPYSGLMRVSFKKRTNGKNGIFDIYANNPYLFGSQTSGRILVVKN